METVLTALVEISCVSTALYQEPPPSKKSAICSCSTDKQSDAAMLCLRVKAEQSPGEC